MTPTLRLGQITDLHLRHHLPGTSAVPARCSRSMPCLLAEAVQQLRQAAVHAVVVTGDLVDHPVDEPDTDDRLRQGRDDLNLVAEQLDHLQCPWVVLPGNHDHAGLFAEAFGHTCLDLDVRGYRLLCFNDWDRYLSPADVPPQGAVAEHVPRRLGSERGRMLAVLADDDPRPQVHLQHYVIWPRRDDGWPHTYHDGEQLRDELVNDPRVRLVLSGHYHAGVEPFRVHGPRSAPWFCVAPAFCQAPHPVLVHELHADGHMTSNRIDLRPAAVAQSAPAS